MTTTIQLCKYTGPRIGQEHEADAYKTYYRYYVKSGSPTSIMTPFVTLTKDQDDQIAKNVVNTDGGVAEVHVDLDDDGDLDKLRSYTYYTSGGAYTYYKYDTLHRLTNVYYNAGAPSSPFEYPAGNGHVQYGYTVSSVDYGEGAKTSMTETSGTKTSSYVYDSQGRLRRYTPPVGLPQYYYEEYDYNNAGAKTAIRITDGTTTPYDVSYDYFANGWLKEVKSDGARVALSGYESDSGKPGAVGLRTKVTNGNGTYAVFAYDETDPRYPLTSITHKDGSDATLATLGYSSRDNVGNPLSMSDWTGSWAYTYDSMSRLDSATPPNPIPDQPCGGDYGYDWVGNRLNPPSGANHMVYNNADQLTSWPGMHRYTYYNDGSLHEVHNTKSPTPDLIASYTYTPTGLLDTASYGGRTLENTWDADSNRVALTTPGATYDLTRQFTYDPAAGIPAVLQETEVNDPEDPDDDVFIYYIREPGGALIARTEGASTGYYHFDQLGSTRLLTSGSGAVTDRYAYDAYGALVWHGREDGSIDQPYQFVGRLGYYTHYQEPEFGLLQLGVRFYDAEPQTFSQRDPAKDGIGWYGYVGQNPILYTDPSGRMRNVQVCGNGGHIWLCMSAGNSRCYGFHPAGGTAAAKGGRAIAGRVELDTGYMYDEGGGGSSSSSGSSRSSSSSRSGGGTTGKHRCRLLMVCDSTYECMMNVISRDYLNPPQFKLKPQDEGPPYNCVTWTDHIFAACGSNVYHSSSPTRLWPANP